MRFVVLRRAKGTAKFGWSLNTATGPFVGRSIEITAG
jgi:hypothetical protein